MKSTITSESFKITPLNPKTLLNETALSAAPRIGITPVKAKGMTAMMMNGFVNERSGIARSAIANLR